MPVTVHGVTKFYGAQKALDNVSFELKAGEITGFLGPNGAGKSTMMKIITGYIPATSGRVKINGSDVLTDSMEIRKMTGYLPENNPLYPEMYVREYLSFTASFYKKGTPRKQQIDNIIELTGLVPEQGKKIGSLSKGYRQRVGLAQALIHDPEVLILDEATTGLDPNQVVEIRNLIREAGKEKTVMLSTHVMQEVEAICDRVIIIDKGVIVADEEKNNIYSRIRKGSRSIEAEFDRPVPESDIRLLPGVVSAVCIRENTWLITTGDESDIRRTIFDFAVKKNLTVLSLVKKESNLEEVFRQLTGNR